MSFSEVVHCLAMINYLLTTSLLSLREHLKPRPCRIRQYGEAVVWDFRTWTRTRIQLGRWFGTPVEGRGLAEKISPAHELTKNNKPLSIAPMGNKNGPKPIAPEASVNNLSWLELYQTSERKMVRPLNPAKYCCQTHRSSLTAWERQIKTMRSSNAKVRLIKRRRNAQQGPTLYKQNLFLTSFRWGTFGHVTRLDHSRQRK